MASEVSAREHRSVDRLINFSDAVVAVAVTLLALPLVDLGPPPTGQTVWEFAGDHAGPIYSFAFTFLVGFVIWLTHNRILNSLTRLDPTIVWLNAFWLLLIVMLPWFSAMYGESAIFVDAGTSSDGVAMLYWAAMAALSLLGWAMAQRLRRAPQLLAPDERRPRSAVLLARGPILAAYFLLIGITSLFDSALTAWLPLGIIPLSYFLRPHGGRETDADGEPSAD